MKYQQKEISKGDWKIRVKSLFPSTYANIEIIYDNGYGEMKGEFSPTNLEDLIILLEEINKLK